MYLNRKQRIEICQILKNILEKDGYLIVTNSHVFPPAPDPVESYYRHSLKVYMLICLMILQLWIVQL